MKRLLPLHEMAENFGLVLQADAQDGYHCDLPEEEEPLQAGRTTVQDALSASQTCHHPS